MSNFYISDTHFGHKRIIELCDRPFKDVSHMNEILVANWNETVSPEDDVFHLGDVAMGSWELWDGVLSRLNGHIHLIIGNHDRLFESNSQSHRERFAPIYDQWFEDASTSSIHTLTLTDDTYRDAMLSHFPYDGDSHGEDRYTKARLQDRGLPLIHGHTHLDSKFSVSKAGTHQMHVGVDAWDYRPVPESAIIDWLETL